MRPFSEEATQTVSCSVLYSPATQNRSLAGVLEEPAHHYTIGSLAPNFGADGSVSRAARVKTAPGRSDAPALGSSWRNG